ncbi:hypothetical protein ACP70R_023953 [Stipagrostis hirtigluma subsp. patula]
MVVGDMAAERSVVSVLGLGHVPSTGEYKVLRIQSEPWETCQVRTLGSGSNGGWRQRPWPPVIISESSSKKMAFVGGVAYFLVDQDKIEPDSIASFDLATEEWRPTMIQGPLSSVFATTGDKLKYRIRRRDLSLAKLNDSLVMVNYNCQDGSRDLWFLDDMDKPLWTKRYSVQRDDVLLCNYHPLAVLDDGKIIFLVDKDLKSYDPRTNTWADLTMLRGYISVRMHHGSLF